MPLIDGKSIDVLFSEQDIAKRNRIMATEIAAKKPQNLLVLPILKGSFIFAADLIRELHRAGVSSTVEFITISSYGAGQESGEIKLLHDFDLSLIHI